MFTCSLIILASIAIFAMMRDAHKIIQASTNSSEQ
jgi:hypothetical protein